MIRTKQQVLLLLVLVLAWIALVLVAHTRANIADELWNKYRVNVISLLQGMYGRYANGLNHFGSNVDLDQTVLHIVTDPIEATWNGDLSNLDNFAGYVPKWQTAWNVDFTKRSTVAEKYYELLHSMNNKTLASQQYVKYSSAAKTNYEESPYHERLQQFVQRMQGKTTHDVHFVVEEGSGSTTIHSPWGIKTSSFSHMTSIVRELRLPEVGADETKAKFVDFDQEFDMNFAQALEQDEDAQAQLKEFIKKSFESGHVEELEDMFFDSEEEEEEFNEDGEDESQSENVAQRIGLILLQRQLAIQKPITIQSKKFHMDFKAVGLIGIPVRAPFVDRAFIRQHRAQFQGNWFGANGQFSLMPSIVWVALKPQCTLRVSESEFKLMQQQWNSGSALGMAIAGVFFRNNLFRQMALSDMGEEALGDLFSHSALEYMRQSGDLEDEASFQVKSLDANGNEVAADTSDEAIFTVKADSDEDDQMVPHSSFLNKLIQIILKRQPPPPPQIVEKVYEASFKSNSDVPQVLAITSDIL